MRELLLLFFMCVALMPGVAVGREITPVSNDWTFRFAHQVAGRGQRVDLPHTWNAADALSGRPDYYRGMGVYERIVDWNPEWNGKKLFLRFKGANQVAEVFVDSRYAGGHRGGYGAFVVDVTDFLKRDGRSVVTVKVTNALDLGVMPLVGDFNMYGGLYRGVDLVAVEPLHISLNDYASPGVYLTQRHVGRKQADVEAVVVVANAGRVSVDAKVRLSVSDGKNVVAESVSRVTVDADSVVRAVGRLSIENPRLWNGRRDPFVYSAVAELMDGEGTVVDRVEQPLGLRWFEVDPAYGFVLNGEPLRLRGVCRHQDRAERGNALLFEHHAEDAAFIREIGANAVRLAHYPQADEFYSLMDRDGMVVWAEIPFIGPGGYLDRGFNDIPSFRENGMEQLRELIRQNYNHPSICFWGIFNELKTHGDNPVEYVGQLNDLAHAEDPTRLTTAASFLSADDPLNAVTDLIAWNQYFGWYGGSPSDLGRWLDDVRRNHPSYCIGLSEYGAGASVYHQQDSITAVQPTGRWHPENYQTLYHMGSWRAISERPFVWASFVWNLFDFGAAHRTEGDRDGINDKGLVTFDRKTRKDSYYYYKANWNTDDLFVYIAGRRHLHRASAVTDVTVFSNCSEVELKVNGRSVGRKKSDGFGTFVFSDVMLTPGENSVTAVAVGNKGVPADTIVWNLR